MGKLRLTYFRFARWSCDVISGTLLWLVPIGTWASQTSVRMAHLSKDYDEAIWDSGYDRFTGKPWKS